MNLVRNPVILALDVDTRDAAFRLLDSVGDVVGAVKLGPRLVYRFGAELVTEIAQVAPVFVDNKYFDITSTMVAAVRASFDAGATLVTVHALAGSAALKNLAALEKELSAIRPFRILAVTILTSWEQSSLPAGFQPWPIKTHVQSLANEALHAGIRGLVCSGHELEFLTMPEMFKVVPGIRLSADNDGTEDQKRIMTPSQAMKAGASALVIGRPILQSNKPRETVLEILESCAK